MKCSPAHCRITGVPIASTILASLEGMSYCVVSSQAFIFRHGVSCRRYVADTSSVMSATLHVGKGVKNDMSCRLFPTCHCCRQFHDCFLSSNTKLGYPYVWADLNLSAFIDINWVLGMSWTLLCRYDTPC